MLFNVTFRFLGWVISGKYPVVNFGDECLDSIRTEFLDQLHNFDLLKEDSLLWS